MSRFSLKSLMGVVALVAIAWAAARVVLPNWKHRAHALIRVQSGVGYIGLTPEVVAQARDAYVEDKLQLLRSDKVLGSALNKPGIASLRLIRTKPEPVNWLRDALRIAPVGASGELVEIFLCGDDATEVECVLNAIVDSFREEIGDAEPPRVILLQPVTVTSWQESLGL